MSHECKCFRPAGSIHGNCNKCYGKLPQPMSGSRFSDYTQGWTGAKKRNRSNRGDYGTIVKKQGK